MALNKVVQMSSRHTSFYGSHCTDGIYGKDSASKFCHTGGSVSSEWIRIDLGSRKIVTFLIIHNRFTENLDVLGRLSQIDINVFNNRDTKDNHRLCAHIGDTTAKVHFARCTKPLLARYVEMVQLNIGQVRAMNIAEIMVY